MASVTVELVEQLMARRPKPSTRGLFEAPVGNEWLEGFFVTDGDVRWRIGTDARAHLDDGKSAFSIDGSQVIATRSGGMAAISFVKAMVHPWRFLDLHGRMPWRGQPTVLGQAKDDDGRACFALALATEPQQRWLVDAEEGHVLTIDDGTNVARLRQLTSAFELDLASFTWGGEVDDDDRSPQA